MVFPVKNKIFLTAVAAIAIVAVSIAVSAEMPDARVADLEKPCVNSSEVGLLLQMRVLWEEHVVWTRMLIISIAGNLSDTQPVTERLLRNYDDMEEAFLPYYGEEAAKEYGGLVEDHLLIAADLVKAAKAGNSTAVADATMQWYQNADNISIFLNETNPSWGLNETKAMWYNHLNLTKQEAVARLNKNYTADIDLFDTIRRQAAGMAGDQTQGIVEQFPDKFGKC